MTNRIREVHIFHSIKDPTFAEVWISVYPDSLTSTTEVRGAWRGPQCAYSSTIEVAYPLREASRLYEKEDRPHIISVAGIPEPSLWEPETPFTYQGTVELWEAGACCEKTMLARGLRDLALTANGLLLNGRPFTVHGVAREGLSPADLPELRRAGFNTILTRLTADSAGLWSEADRLGFFVIDWLADRESIRHAGQLGDHSCTLAGVTPAQADEPEVVRLLAPRAFPVADKRRLGVEWIANQSAPLSETCDFVLCDESLLPSLHSIRLPKLVRVHGESVDEAKRQELRATPGVMGWILDLRT